jgi:hypothetical protein
VKQEERDFVKNKRLILSKRDTRHFAHPNFTGTDFSKVEEDQRKIHMKQLYPPIDTKPLQTAGFMRTKREGENFMRTTGSIC